MNRIQSFTSYCIALICVGSAESSAHASVTEYTTSSAWQSATGAFTTIHFTELPDATLVTSQYQAMGVNFTDGEDYVRVHLGLYTNDGAGLIGAFDSITVEFTQPMMSIAVEYPGGMMLELYWQNMLMFTSQLHLAPPGGLAFLGLKSDALFDKARIFDPLGDVSIDDLHFGPPIPAPPMLALLAVAGLVTKGRRRTA